MSQIKWKLSNCHGYGDVVAAVSYAVNEHHITDKQIQLEFCFTNDHKSKCKDSDPETLEDRCRVVFDYYNCPGVDLSFSYQYQGKSSQGYRGPQGSDQRWPHDGTDPLYKYLNLAFANKHEYKPLEKIVVGSSRHNKEPFGSHGKNWKDPLEGRYRHLLEKISDYDVEELYYSTPVEQVISSIEQCDLFIGYHGSSTWIARMLGKPMVVFSRRHVYSTWDFPWCEHVGGLSQLVDLEQKHKRSFNNISLCINQHQMYIERTKNKK